MCTHMPSGEQASFSGSILKLCYQFVYVLPMVVDMSLGYNSCVFPEYCLFLTE